MPYEWNGKCVTVVASTELHFRAVHLLASAASHDLKEAVPVNVKKVLEIVKRQNYALGFRNLPVWAEWRVANFGSPFLA